MTATKGGDGTTVAFGFYNENNLLDADAAKFEGKVVVLEYSAKLNRNAVADSTDKSALGRITVNSKTLNGGATTIRGLYGGATPSPRPRPRRATSVCCCLPSR